MVDDAKLIDTKEWKTNWEQVREIASGGQGVVFEAKHRNHQSTACLKVLSKQKDTERRTRFLREAVAYDTCNHPGIPRLIESNAAHHRDLESKLYIATEFIPGLTLKQFIDKHGYIDLTSAQTLTCKILQILTYIHDKEFVHRDIKPDNIVLRDGDISKPVLVDFGLCFKDGISEGFDTETYQELGNRFMRLPELSAESTLKKDARSDLAFAAGIFLYAMTGTVPASLLDGESKMPHQRSNIRASLKDRTEGALLQPLLNFFDQAFSQTVEQRFDDAEHMLKVLNRVLDVSGSHGLDMDEDNLNYISAIMENDGAFLERSRVKEQSVAAIDVIRSAYDEVYKRVEKRLDPFRGALTVHLDCIEVTLGFTDKTFGKISKATRTFTVKPTGSELVVGTHSDIIARGENASDMTDLYSAARSIFLAMVKNLFENPGPHLLEGRFFNRTPYSSLALAKKEAQRKEIPIFAVVYEEGHKPQRDLESSLGHFMEYKATKDLVDENFVVVFVKAADARSEKLISDEGDLVAPRWIVFSPNGSVIRDENVYGNPDEGITRVKAVLQKINGSGSLKRMAD